MLSNQLDVCMAAEGVRTNVQKVPLIMLVAEKVAVMGQDVIAANWRRIKIGTARDGHLSLVVPILIQPSYWICIFQNRVLVLH